MPVHQVTPIFRVSHLAHSLEHYVNVLGFAEEFRFEDRYAGLRIGSAGIHLGEGPGDLNRPIGAGNIYFFLDSPAEVDAYYAEITARGAKTGPEPTNYPYGMRDFVVYDPDGNILTFGAETEETPG